MDCEYYCTRCHGRILIADSVTFASIYRATTIAQSASDPDPTWGPIPATIWSVIEANTGIVCACLPMLRGPFVRLFGPLLGVNRSTTKASSYQLSGAEGQPRVATTGNARNHDVYGSLHDCDRDSEEGIFKLPESRKGAHNHARRGSKIVVTNEFSVEINEAEKRKSERHSVDPDRDTLATRSVNEDRPDGKSPHFHI